MEKTADAETRNAFHMYGKLPLGIFRQMEQYNSFRNKMDRDEYVPFKRQHFSFLWKNFAKRNSTWIFPLYFIKKPEVLSHQSNARRVRSSLHNFTKEITQRKNLTKENTGKYQKIQFNRKTF